MPEKCGVMKAPCKSCPYRKDVPSGVWHPDEYAKLPSYDGEIIDQVVNGGTSLFMCHQKDGNLCAGWLATHGIDNLVALRLHAREIKDEVWDYESPSPSSGAGLKLQRTGSRRSRNRVRERSAPSFD